MKKLKPIIESPIFSWVVILLIIANTVILALETDLDIMKHHGESLFFASNIILRLFVLELLLKVMVYKKRILKNYWALFDIIVVAMAFLPSYGVLSVFRSLAVLRVLMLVSDAPKLRRLADGILHAMGGVIGVVFILSLVIFMFAVASTKLYGGAFPEWFGRFDIAFASLTNILTPSGWQAIVPEVAGVAASANIFFGAFIGLSYLLSLTILVAAIADAVHMIDKKERLEEIGILHQIQAEIKSIKKQLKKNV